MKERLGLTDDDVFHGGVWLLSRGLVLAVVYAVASAMSLSAENAPPAWDIAFNILTQRWDAEYYTRIALEGYPAVLPSSDVSTHPWAFYPLFPWVVRAASWVLPLDVGGTSLLVNAVCGVLGAVLLGRWLLRRLPPAGARLGVLFFSFWTQSYFFTYAYAEPIYFVLVCLALLLLDRAEALPLSAVATGLLLGALLGLCRPYAVIVALAAMATAVHRRGWREGPAALLWDPTVLSSAAFGAAVVSTSLYFWYGHCWALTGVFANCAVKAWTVGWGYGDSNLFQAVINDVTDLFTVRPLALWHVVRAWELLALVLGWTCLGLAARRVKTWGLMPLFLGLLPLVTNTTFAHVRSTPRYLATTPTLFLLLGSLHATSRTSQGVLLVLVVLLHVVSATATAAGVWQSF